MAPFGLMLRASGSIDLRPPTMIAFSYKLTGHGWADATISDGVTEAQLTASYLSDALRDLVEAVVSLMQGADRAMCLWLGEPWEHHWILERQGDDVGVTIVWFDYPCSQSLNERGKVIFSTRCGLRKFAMILLNQLWQLLKDWGIDGYRTRWGHAFPMVEYRTLEEMIRNYSVA